MQRIWDKARANRPTIYERQPTALLDKHFKENSVPYEQLLKNFPEFVNRYKPGHPMDTQELYRLLSASLQTRQIRSRNLVIMLLCRDIFLGYFGDEKIATMKAIQLPSMFLWGTPDRCPNASAIRESSRELATSMFDFEAILAKAHEAIQNEIESIIWTILNARIMAYASRDITSDFPFHRPVLYKLLAGLENLMQIPKNSIPVLSDYPTFDCRLIAVLGNSTKNSYWFHAYDFSRLSEDSRSGNEIITKREIKLSSRHVALITMYPWEADHLEKARVMAERGIPVTEPLGKLFLGELEFALFRWVPGTMLMDVLKSDAWKEFGRVIRMCHDNGVMPNDAAGRNAIWNRGNVTLIDFEHTVLNKSAKPLKKQDCEQSLERIREEVGGLLLDSFMKGYSEGRK